MMSSMLLFLDISGGELAIIALVVFIVLGPDKIPDIARKFGKVMRFVRKATEDIKREINVDEDLIQKARSYTYERKIPDNTKTQDSKTLKNDIEPNKEQNNKSDN